jgi:hypothetical protein
MNSHISLRGKFILSALPALALALTLTGCGKTDSEEKVSATPPVSAPVVNSRATFTASPNPAKGAAGLAETSLNWNTTATPGAEIHVGKPDGALLCKGHATGSCATGKWVSDGMTFYLQDSAAAKPTDPAATLAAVVVKVQ